jgi:hypothetical protein
VNSPLEDLALAPLVVKKLRKALLGLAPPLIISLVGLSVSDLHLKFGTEGLDRSILSAYHAPAALNGGHTKGDWALPGCYG